MLAVVQLLLCALAGIGIFWLWRSVAQTSRIILWIVTAGTLIRAVGGQLAFWISYEHWPFARSLQVGRGLWIFAMDAVTYFDTASAAAQRGPAAIMSLPRTLGSVCYVQLLSIGLLAFGSVTAVAILLNIAAYLGTCAMALKLAGTKTPNGIVIFSIAVLSLSPSIVMWSLQPLKDTVFLFLVTAFFVAAYVLQQVWTDGAASFRAGRNVAVTALLAVLVYAIAGIRWYFGFALVVAVVPFAIVAILRGPHRVAALISAIVLAPLLVVMVYAAAEPYIPEALHPSVGLAGGEARPDTNVLTEVDEARRGFDRSAGATLIGAGDAIKKIDASLGAKESRVRVTPPASRTATTPTPATATTASGTALPPPRPIRTGAAPSSPATPQVADEGGVGGASVAVPTSPVARLTAGTAALVLPRWVAQRLGIIKVAGGRGLWVFVEADTIAFDIVLLFAIIGVVRAVPRGALRVPVFWLILLVTGGIAIAVAYTVSNFGTLFRHRDMILLGLTLLPLAAWAVAPSNAAADHVPDEWSPDRAEAAHA